MAAAGSAAARKRGATHTEQRCNIRGILHLPHTHLPTPLPPAVGLTTGERAGWYERKQARCDIGAAQGTPPV
eukprot:scaffold20602_cov109-Isochrysis_galbana.AAC.5